VPKWNTVLESTKNSTGGWSSLCKCPNPIKFEISLRFDVLYPATGIGLRLKVNKHTNTNISIDYGIGINGRKRPLFQPWGSIFNEGRRCCFAESNGNPLTCLLSYTPMASTLKLLIRLAFLVLVHPAFLFCWFKFFKNQVSPR